MQVPDFNDIKYIDLSLQKDYIIDHFEQDDINSRRWYIKITHMGEPFTLADNIEAYLQILKPDNHQVFDDQALTIDLESNVIIIDFSEQMLNVSGLYIGKLLLSDKTDESWIHTPMFKYQVNDRIINAGSIISTDEYGFLLSQIQRVYDCEYKTEDLIAETTQLNQDMTAAENIRESQEASRVSAEAIRVNNETSRQSSENQRNSAESARVTAETAREEMVSTSIANMTSSTTNAINALETVKQQTIEATNNANQAASDADSAADRAINAAVNLENSVKFVVMENNIPTEDRIENTFYLYVINNQT